MVRNKLDIKWKFYNGNIVILVNFNCSNICSKFVINICRGVFFGKEV